MNAKGGRDTKAGDGLPVDGKWLREVRERLGLNQGDFGRMIGLSLRGVQDVESCSTKLRNGHIQAARMASLEIAVERGDPMLALAHVRKLSLELARHINVGP